MEVGRGQLTLDGFREVIEKIQPLREKLNSALNKA